MAGKIRRKLIENENMVRLMDPKNVLKRGYSITTVNGKTITKQMIIFILLFI